MQSKIIIDQTLAKNLINFFGQEWINEHQSYSSHYTSSKASEEVIAYIDNCLTYGFKTSWSLGGTSNNCYGSSYSVSPEIEPELPLLDEFFIEFYPQTSFMQYKIISKFIERDTTSYNDYYGGNTQSGTKELNFKDLSQAMIKAKIITDYSAFTSLDMNNYINDNYSAEKLASIFKPAVSKKKLKK